MNGGPTRPPLQLRAHMPVPRGNGGGGDSAEAARWRAMAQYGLDHINRARRRHHNFIPSIWRQTRKPEYIPSPDQQAWLLDIYNELGGPPID
jgi:hypothetical protein